MKTKTLVSLSLLIGIGAALHFIVPGFFLGMKPDMMLLMMFLAITLFPAKKNVFIVALAAGAISAMTTTFPAGQIPNIIDKLATAFCFTFIHQSKEVFNIRCHRQYLDCRWNIDFRRCLPWFGLLYRFPSRAFRCTFRRCCASCRIVKYSCDGHHLSNCERHRKKIKYTH